MDERERARGGVLTFWRPILLVGVVLLVYAESHHNVFHLDDEPNILRAPAIHVDEISLESLSQVVRRAHLPRRPLPNITLAIDWWRGSGSPEAFQWTNLLLHCLVAWLVYVFLSAALSWRGSDESRKLTGTAALIGALLWAIHPIQVQAVTYIVQRMASMATLFMMASLVCYMRARHGGRGGLAYAAGAAVGAVCALLCKETALILPVLVMLVEFGVLRTGVALAERRWERVLLFLPVAIVLMLAVDLATATGPVSRYVLPLYEARDFSLAERLLTQPRVIFTHLGQIVWPLPSRFSIEHDVAISRNLLDPATTLLALIGVLAWVGAGVWLLLQRERRIHGCFVLWVPASLAIESSFVPLEMVFEHRMYLPTIGLAALLALGARRLLVRGERWRVPSIVVSGLIAALLGWSTWTRVPVWSSRLSVYENAVTHAPGSARAWGNLGLQHLQAGNTEEARAALERSLRIDPEAPKVLEALGVLQMEGGRLDDAENLFRRAMLITGMTSRLLNHFGEVAVKRKDYDRAQSLFLRAIAVAEWNPVHYRNLAVSYELDGECPRALQAWLKYKELEWDAGRQKMLAEHLRDNYLTPGGECYRAAAPR